MIYKLKDRRVQLRGSGHFIAPSASLVGSIILEHQVSVCFNAVIRAEADTVHIGQGSNVQDGAVLHVDPGWPLHIGSGVTVGHKAMLHGCTVDDGSLVGINAVVLNGARIGKGCVIGANALVPEKMVVPDGSLVLGSPARVVRQLSPEQRAEVAAAAAHYVANATWYLDALEIDDEHAHR